MTQTNTLQDRIAAACQSAPAGTKARNKALQGIRWVLKDFHGNYAFLNDIDCDLTPNLHEASVFTACDNEVAKRKFWEAQLGCNLEIEVLP